MHGSDLIEGEKNRLVLLLNRKFAHINLMDLPNLAEQIEYILEYEINTFLFTLLSSEENTNLTKGRDFFLGRKGDYLELKVGFDIKDSSLFVISLNTKKLNFSGKIYSKTIEVHSIGKARKISIIYPKSYRKSLNVETIVQYVRILFETGYEWFRTTAEKVVYRKQCQLVENLYDYLKKIVPNSQIRENLWFAAITEGYGFRLIDGNTAMKAFNLINQSSQKYQISTTRIFSDLVTTRLPSSGLLMNIAASDERCINGEIAKAQYSKDGSIYSLTMIALYNNSSFSIYPIFRSVDISVFALFPTDKRNQIEPILKANKNYLESIIKKLGRKIHKAAHIFDRTRSNKLYSIDSFNKAIILQPNYYGIGVNINYLLERIFKSD